MSTAIYIGRDNLLEESTVTCATSANEELLATRSTGRSLITSAGTSHTITAAWAGAEKTLSSFAMVEHNAASATSPTWRIQPYDHEVPASGSVVADSGVLDMVPAVLASPPFASPKLSTSIYTFRQTVGGRRVPDEIACKSVVFTLAAGASFAFEVGYGWAGLSHGLSDWAALGADDSVSVDTRSRVVETHGFGVSFVDDVLDGEVALSLPVLSAEDREALLQVFEGVGISAPWLLHLPDVAARDARSRGGVFRFTPKGLQISPLGAVLGRARDLYRCETRLAAWK